MGFWVVTGWSPDSGDLGGLSNMIVWLLYIVTGIWWLGRLESYVIIWFLYIDTMYIGHLYFGMGAVPKTHAWGGLVAHLYFGMGALPKTHAWGVGVFLEYWNILELHQHRCSCVAMLVQYTSYPVTKAHCVGRNATRPEKYVSAYMTWWWQNGNWGLKIRIRDGPSATDRNRTAQMCLVGGGSFWLCCMFFCMITGPSFLEHWNIGIWNIAINILPILEIWWWQNGNWGLKIGIRDGPEMGSFWFCSFFLHDYSTFIFACCRKVGSCGQFRRFRVLCCMRCRCIFVILEYWNLEYCD